MAINISSGPRPTPSLASLNFDGAVDNRRKNLEVVKQAQDERRAFDRETNAKIRDDFEKSKIIHGQILAATQQNPEIVNQLQASVDSGSNDATTKAYKRFIDGTHTQSDLAVINAYITAATTQQETQRIQDQRDLEANIAAAERDGKIAAASFAGTVYTGKEQEEIDAITSGQYLQESFDYAAQNNITGNALVAFNAANTKFSQSIDASDEPVDIRTYKFTDIENRKLREFVDKGDFSSAKMMMRNLGIPTTYKPIGGGAEESYSNEFFKREFGSQPIAEAPSGTPSPVATQPASVAPVELTVEDAEEIKAADTIADTREEVQEFNDLKKQIAKNKKQIEKTKKTLEDKDFQPAFGGTEMNQAFYEKRLKTLETIQRELLSQLQAITPSYKSGNSNILGIKFKK
mgnify:CR=1 FL=1